MSNRQAIEITTGTMLRALLLILGAVFLYFVRDVLVILLLSVVIASAIEPGVRWFVEKFRSPRVLAVLAVYLLGFALFILVFYLVIPPMVQELKNFAVAFPVSLEGAFDQARNLLDRTLLFAPDYLRPSASDLSARLNTFLNERALGFFSFGSSLFGGVVSFIFVIVLSFYFAVQENGISNFLKIITPLEHEAYVVDLWTRSQRKIGKWLQGQLLLGLLVGVMVYLGLTLMGVRYALILALLAAVFELIPIFGPIMAAIPSVLVAFIQAPALGLWVVLLYVVVQQMENHLIYPLVVRQAVGVPPLLVIIALLIGGKLAGFLGFVLAVPIAAAVVEYVNDVAVQKKIYERM